MADDKTSLDDAQDNVPSKEILEDARAAALASLDVLLDALPENEQILFSDGVTANLEQVVGRDVTAQDIDYLRKRFPYLQIVNTGKSVPRHEKPKIQTAKSGWTIVDYGNGLSASPGEHLWQGHPAEITSEGTTTPLMQQANDTAKQMANLANEYGWPGVEIISGSDIMKWSVWQQSRQHGMLVEGYEPDDKASEKYVRIFQHKAKHAG